MLPRLDELLPGLGRKVVRLQPGVKMLQLAKWLDARGLECSFAPGAKPCVSPAIACPRMLHVCLCSGGPDGTQQPYLMGIMAGMMP